MNREELITAVAAKTGLTKKSAEEVLDTIQDTIMDAVRDGDKMALAGFGTFQLHERPAHKGRNPRTGEPIEIAARKRPRFLPGKHFRDLAK
jgi:DNA-binding protein HU-beta